MTRPKHVASLASIALLAFAQLAVAADWPVYRHDNQRTSVTTEQIDAGGLGLLWSWRSPHPPLRAWAGAAARDAYHGMRELPDMRDYDPAFYTVAAGGKVFFGSSMDDAVRCMDAATGNLVWRYTTDGPVRIAPSVVNGKVYFGSDDGWVYCLSAVDGQVIWKYSPQPTARRILNNGRAIALQPCRTGVLIDKGIAYCAFSLLPWERSYLCALDAETGKPTGKDRYVRTYEALSLEAAAALSADTMFICQGRTAMMRFRRSDGKDVGGIGGGGTFVSLNGGEVLHGPGPRSHELGGVNGAKDVVVSGGNRYAVGNRSAVCLVRKGRKWGAKWSVALPGGRGLILAGNTVFAGGADRVVALGAADGKQLWSGVVDGRACGLTASDGRVIVSTDKGHVFCFGPGGNAEAAMPPAPKGRQKGAVDKAPISLPVGPYVQFTDPDKAVVYWETSEPSPTVIEYGRGEHYRTIEKPEKTTVHAAELTGLKVGVGYTYIIRATVGGTLRSTHERVIDAFFNYALPAVDAGAHPFPEDDATKACAAAAERIVARTDVRNGLCVVVGCGDGRLAWELAKRTRMRVLGFDRDAAAVAAGRAALMKAGAYGQRVSLHHAPKEDDILLVGDVANVVVSQRALIDGKTGYAASEVRRLAKPGGVVMLDPSKDPVRKPVPEWAGVWSHQYGWGANAAYGGEELAGASHSSQLGAQWVGRPGPRYQPDREPRKPSPLAVGGRLFAQGLERIVALDAHNGVVLWSLEVPGLKRFNMPDDCGNWCADENFVWAVVAQRCWQIDAATGTVVKKHRVVGENVHWGYVGREGKVLVGSTIRPGSTFTGFTGKRGWYDDASSNKICSSGLFALDPVTGKTLWTHRKGTIINSTITLTPDVAYFLEGRGGNLWGDQTLVALDTLTGKPVWEAPFKSPGGSIVYFLAHSADKLVLLANHRGSYHVYGFSANGGKQLWHSTAHGGGDHGAHMTHPAIVDGKVFARPRVFDLETGKDLGPMPSGGCGSYSASRYGIFFRALHSTMWSYTRNEGSNFHRLRPDCWLSTVPGCGMLLSPEASGGCWCGRWMETSVGFRPKTDVPVFKTADLQFTKQLDVIIRKPLGGGTVHYTVDGTDPTPASPPADKLIHITKTTEVRACVVRDGKAGKTVGRTFHLIESKIATELTVNFQPPGHVPDDCVGDFGEPFAVRPNGYAYGWSRPMKDAVRNRGRRAGYMHTTQIFFMPGITWSIAVENGTYEVTVSCGDAAYRVPDATVYVNGVTLCEGVGLGAEQFKSFTKDVKVTDGRLTMSSHQKAAPVDRTRINFIKFKKK